MRAAVECWCVRLDAAAEPFYATLSDEERSRAARFRFERDRRRFVVARGALRELLGRYLDTDPGQIRFIYNAFDKPELDPDFGRLNFNLAHSGDIAQNFFSATEVDALSRVPSHLYDQAFFSCWTMKEAYVKGRAEGLTLPLTSFSVPITTDPAPAAVRCGRWSLFTLQPAPGYVGALAVTL